MVLSTLIGYCHPLGSGGSGKEGNGVMVEWQREVIGKEKKGESGGRDESWFVAEKESIRKKDLNDATQLFSPDLNTDSGKVSVNPRALTQLNSV